MGLIKFFDPVTGNSQNVSDESGVVLPQLVQAALDRGYKPPPGFNVTPGFEADRPMVSGLPLGQSGQFQQPRLTGPGGRELIDPAFFTPRAIGTTGIVPTTSRQPAPIAGIEPKDLMALLGMDLSQDSQNGIKQNLLQTGKDGATGLEPSTIQSRRGITNLTTLNQIPFGGQIQLRSADGTTVTARTVSEIEQFLDGNPGGGLLRSDGTRMNIQRMPAGGILADGVPLNVLLGGDLLPEQRDLLESLGMPIPGEDFQVPNLRPGILGTNRPNGGVTTLDPGPVNQGQPPPTPFDVGEDDDIQDIIRKFMTLAVGRLSGAEGLQGNAEDFFNNLLQAFNTESTTRTAGVEDLLGRTVPGLQGFLDRADQGLSPGVAQALRALQTGEFEDRFDQQFGNLQTQLLQRGATGLGDTPTDVGAFLRGFGPILEGQERARRETDAGILLQDEQARQQNRANALSALGQFGGLTGTVGNLFDPARFLPALSQAAGLPISAFEAGTGALSPAGQALGVGASQDPNALRNTLLGALLPMIPDLLALIRDNMGEGPQSVDNPRPIFGVNLPDINIGGGGDRRDQLGPGFTPGLENPGVLGTIGRALGGFLPFL